MLPATRVSLGLSSVAVGLALAHSAWRSRRRYSFANRTVVITGGSRGLGLAIARQLADEGARLWLVARSSRALHEAADELRRRGAAFVEIVAADLRREGDIERVVERVLRAGDTVDVLINNAGVIEVGPFEHTQTEDFEESLATHFWAPLHLIRQLLRHFRRDGEGRIVNISSVGGRVAVPHLSAYAAGKFALTGLSETLRSELVKSGIYVTTVTPGLMRTGSYVNVRLRGDHAREFRWFAGLAATPLTSLHADRAAAQIIDAVREGRAVVAPGWQSRAAQVAAAVAPNVTARLVALVDRTVLPAPVKTRTVESSRGESGTADEARMAADVDPGRVKAMLDPATRRRYRQQRPAWS